ncbi:MAG: hypothetical protein QSU88_08275 [Candidatus Methanoperedens sp.]|nr:hypothetical protein [Candidatus Methanoperedens sp.]
MTQPEPVKKTPSGPSTETLAARHDRARALLERGSGLAQIAFGFITCKFELFTENAHNVIESRSTTVGTT